jgi:two-component system, cell cycle response regulator
MTTGTMRALLISADPADLERLQAALEKSGSSRLVLEHAQSRPAALPRLVGERWDALLLDVPSADAPAMETISRLRDLAPDVPIVVLNAVEDESLALRALKAGAQDSIPKKQLDGQLLLRAVRYAIERHQLQIALRAMSLIDDLTGLYNRRGLLALAQQQLRMADRMGKRLTLMFVDLDGLKVVNDSFGHREGDILLNETAQLLKETFRDSDIIARIGGDEFVVLAMESTNVSPSAWTTRLRERLAERNTAERPMPLQLSVGVAFYDPDFPTTIEALLARADQLMYQEKRLKRPSQAARLTPWFDSGTLAAEADLRMD